MSKRGNSERDILNGFNDSMSGSGHTDITGVWKVTVTRANGDIEEKTLKNIVVRNGLNALARHMVDLAGATGESPFNFLGIGTISTVPTISDSDLTGAVEGNGSVVRKPGATLAASHEVALIVATWAGFVDTLTSVSLEEAGWFNNTLSGQGDMMNRVTGVNAVLADSDFLKLQVEVQIGSHDLGG